METESLQLPSMLLQPFVENAIEHGIRQKPGTGKVVVKVGKQKRSFEVIIEDDGIGRDQGPRDKRA
ncbi:MAG: hypothetical protein U5Q03_06080 [Bacteroidota bacterium]|nr:hypothetical protein [Bacteroidota bacterium]